MTKTKKNSNIIKRSLARLIAVQTLYQYDFYKAEKDIELLMNELLDNYVLNDNEENQDNVSYRKKTDLKFLEKLLSNIISLLPEIDPQISKNLKDEWKIEQLSSLMLQILRLAIFELRFFENIPSKVIVSEYVDIAGCFYDPKQVTFVNGILDKIAKNKE